MAIPALLRSLTGSWTGTNVLHRPWLEGPAAVSDSASRATITSAVNGTFLSIAYDWVLDGERHEGLLLVGVLADAEQVRAAWTDSWHMRDDVMRCTGRVDEGRVDMFGTYVVPGHPDWGWRTRITPHDADSFDLVMYNVTPDGQETLAVDCRYTRAR